MLRRTCFGRLRRAWCRDRSLSSSLSVSRQASTSSLPPTARNEMLQTPVIQLEKQESQVLDLIDNFTKHLAAARADLPRVECRVAGGWVRDKLLNYRCEDLDVCISSLTGHHFATLLESYLAELREHDPLLTTTKIAKIQANPDQSKHLETARMTVMGMEIDLVQLRSEEYASEGSSQGGSRIPTAIKFGTPLEDALRRDITINTLFYNIHTREVEDWTGKGLSDLLSDSPLIRTPLEPLQTFLDDPLRILRCVRFASRFNFPLDASIKPAVEDERVRSALVHKVSKERVGVEYEKMLKGKDPLHSLRLIKELSLYHLVFGPTAKYEVSAAFPEDAASQAIAAGEILEYLQASSHEEVPPPLLSPLQNPGARKRMWLAISLSPIRGITFLEKKGKTSPLSDTLVRDSIKFPNLERTFVQHIFAAQPKLSSPDLAKFQAQGSEKERSKIGLLLRDLDVHDPLSELTWRTSLLFALVIDLLPHWRDGRPDQAAFKQTVQRYTSFVERVEALNLDTLAFEKPMLDGKEMATLLAIKPGKIIAVLTQKVIEWQLDHPGATKEDCAAFLKSEWEAGRIAEPESASGKEDKRGKKRKDST